jgi:hypothetical protein
MMFGATPAARAADPAFLSKPRRDTTIFMSLLLAAVASLTH